MVDQPYPESALILSLLGGIFILIGGLILLPIFIGIFGVICAIIVMYSAYNLKADPSNHVTAGVTIIVLSLLSWIGAIGGFFIGFLLSLIGGILALTWEGRSMSVPAPSHGDKICPFCANTIPETATFCPKCGSQLGSH